MFIIYQLFIITALFSLNNWTPWRSYISFVLIIGQEIIISTLQDI